MAKIEKKTKRYPTDLTDEEWDRIVAFLPKPAKKGRKPGMDMREVLNAIRYVACAGCGWRMLEHTLQPFSAEAELRRVLKDGGHLFLTTPYNFRIHGPLPDCWRFTEYGLRALLGGFAILSLTALETTECPLMPIQYTTVARKV
jgi:transposase